MNKRVRAILSEISRLEEELAEHLREGEQALRYRLDGTRVRFEQTIRDSHRRLRTGVVRWLLASDVRNVLSAPLIYPIALVFLFLDVSVSLYQLLCFPLYRLERIDRRHHIIIDRHQLAYLNWIEKLNCIYCGYASGVLSYARAVVFRTEQYWCPIKHASAIAEPLRDYAGFASYGDAEAYPVTIKALRQAGQRRACEPASSEDDAAPS